MASDLAAGKPTFILSHGAFADSSGWGDNSSTLSALDSVARGS